MEATSISFLVCWQDVYYILLNKKKIDVKPGKTETNYNKFLFIQKLVTWNMKLSIRKSEKQKPTLQRLLTL